MASETTIISSFGDVQYGNQWLSPSASYHAFLVRNSNTVIWAERKNASTTSTGDDGYAEVIAEIWGGLGVYSHPNGVHPARRTDATAFTPVDDGGDYGATYYYFLKTPGASGTGDNAPMTPQRSMGAIVGSGLVHNSLGYLDVSVHHLYPIFRTRNSYSNNPLTNQTAWKRRVKFATQAEINAFSRQGTNPSKGGPGGPGSAGGTGGPGGLGAYYNGSVVAAGTSSGVAGVNLGNNGTPGNSGTTIRGIDMDHTTAEITTMATNMQYTKTWGTHKSGDGGRGGRGGTGGTGGSGGTGGILVEVGNLYNAAAASPGAAGGDGGDGGDGGRGGSGTNDSRWSGSDNYSQSKEDAALGVVGGVNGSGGSGGGSVVGGAAASAIGFVAEDLSGAIYTYTENTD